MSEGVPFRSRPDLQWQIVLVNPRLLRAVQRRLRCSSPSHAIEEALRLALGRERSIPPEGVKRLPVH
jgi:hypothetical protein